MSSANDDSTKGQWQRQACMQCNKARVYYCPSCFVPLQAPEGIVVPKVNLPLKIIIYFQDKLKKSTAPQAKVLAPSDVEIVPWSTLNDSSSESCLPSFDKSSALVVYPAQSSTTILDIDTDQLAAITTLVFIDCPWKKAPSILQHSSLKNLKCVKLADPPPHSRFWRYHHAGAGCLSTIEAIELMLQEYIKAAEQKKIALRKSTTSAEVSSILFYFNQLHQVIASKFTGEKHAPPMDEGAKELRRQTAKKTKYDQRTAAKMKKAAQAQRI